MDENYLTNAIEIAIEKSKDGKHGPFGAVICQNKEIVSEGWSQVIELQDPTAHAEIMAIRKACKRLTTITLDSCILYSSCQPCPMCLSAIYWARIPKVYFAATTNDAAKIGFIDKTIFNEICNASSQKLVEIIHFPIQYAIKPFDLWLKNPHRIMY